MRLILREIDIFDGSFSEKLVTGYNKLPKALQSGAPFTNMDYL